MVLNKKRKRKKRESKDLAANDQLEFNSSKERERVTKLLILELTFGIFILELTFGISKCQCECSKWPQNRQYFLVSNMCSYGYLEL